jgi:hypothetical protein
MKLRAKFVTLVSDLHLRHCIFRNTKLDAVIKALGITSRAPALLYAALRNDRALTLAMLSQGCDPFLPNGQGITAWCYIQKYGFEDEARKAMNAFASSSLVEGDRGNCVSSKDDTSSKEGEKKLCIYHNPSLMGDDVPLFEE